MVSAIVAATAVVKIPHKWKKSEHRPLFFNVFRCVSQILLVCICCWMLVCRVRFENMHVSCQYMCAREQKKKKISREIIILNDKRPVRECECIVSFCFFFRQLRTSLYITSSSSLIVRHMFVRACQCVCVCLHGYTVVCVWTQCVRIGEQRTRTQIGTFGCAHCNVIGRSLARIYA